MQCVTLKYNSEKIKSQVIIVSILLFSADNSKLKENLESEKPVEQHYVKEILQEVIILFLCRIYFIL